MQKGLQAAVTALRGLRPRWAWILFACGLPWLLTPLSCSASATGCLAVLSAWCFWIFAGVIGFLGLRWLWRKLLFKVSRRLWVILLFVSILPALTLTVFFLSTGWMALGAQVSRAIQGGLRTHEQALRLAAEEASDRAALQSIQVLGEAWVAHIDSLPKGMKPNQPLLIYTQVQEKPQSKDVFMRVASPSTRGFRLLTLSIHDIGESGRKLWGGRVHYRLDWGEEGARNTAKGDPPKVSTSERPVGVVVDSEDLEGGNLLGNRKPLVTWSQGDVAKGGLLLRPFSLPPVSVRVVDWESGRPMVLTLRPETSLKEIFLGFGFGEGNLSATAALIVGGLVLVLLALGGVQLLALMKGLGLARDLGKSVDGLFRGVGRLSQGDFHFRIQPHGRDQVAQLTLAFNEMAQRLEDADGERQERLRLEEELRIAREVQMHLLPDVAALAPAIRATIIPAREVAGDFFDLARLDDGRQAFFIADVSGKGTSAAFYAAETKGVLAALDKNSLDPKEVLGRLNSIWCANRRPRLFMTAIYGTFDPVSGHFRFARAGHPPAFLRRAEGRVERLLPRGLGIGLSAHQFAGTVEQVEGRLEPGESLILYTDGLTEAQSPDDSLFGEAHLAEVLQAEGDPRTLILAAVEAFIQGRPLEDDLTLLILQR